MADNVAITEGTGTSIATDDIGGVQFQRVKVTYGDDGSATDVSSSNRLPVDTGTVAVTGTFWQATQPVSLSALPALAAGTNLIGQASASNETGTVYNGTTALTPKFATIAASSSGNNTLVAAVTSKKIRVLAYNFIANGTVNAKFQSGAGGTDLTGLKYCVANGGICAPYNPVGWFETASNTLLNLNLSGAVAVGGELVYVEV